jgi:acetyl-CoA synthetase
LEAALLENHSCAEAAVVGYPHDIKGYALSSFVFYFKLISFYSQGIIAYCVIKTGFNESVEMEQALRMTVRKVVGPFAAPDIIILTPGLPKTRSGKIMRRILRKIAANESSPEQLGGIFQYLSLSPSLSLPPSPSPLLLPLWMIFYST